MSKGNGAIAGIIFDLDGTLVDSALDFHAMRREMGLAGTLPLLEAMAELEGKDLLHCRQVLDRHEQQGAERATPMPGIAEFLGHLDRLGLRRAVFTRNSRACAARSLVRCGLVFDLILTREDGPVKPDPWAVHYICQAWSIAPGQVAVIGDYRFDVEAGVHAGSRAVLYTQGRPAAGLPGAELAHHHLHSYLESGELLAALGLPPIDC